MKKTLICTTHIGYADKPNFTNNCTYVVEKENQDGYIVVNNNGKTRLISFEDVGEEEEKSFRLEYKTELEIFLLVTLT
ncbi:hypothetical protein [Paenibacillus agricola]|uniref:Uncharacterized protein n=1 Tax=Paenibacillus agricola TaxID=2716264 RepID=A0ABX0J9F4_9BACL|nr:hypothetical protein [Paenibacillus agricola]NHN33050.1 hypothetical protein [Paenibacillus agricola]